MDKVLLAPADCLGGDEGDVAAHLRAVHAQYLLPVARDLAAGRCHLEGKQGGRPAKVVRPCAPDGRWQVAVAALTAPSGLDRLGVVPAGTTLLRVAVSVFDAVGRRWDLAGHVDTRPWARALCSPEWEEHLTCMGRRDGVAWQYSMAVAPDGYPLALPMAWSD